MKRFFRVTKTVETTISIESEDDGNTSDRAVDIDAHTAEYFALCRPVKWDDVENSMVVTEMKIQE